MELNELNSIKMTRFCFIICKIPLNTCPDSLWALKNRSAILWFILSKSRMGGQVVVEAALPVLWTDNFLIKMMAYRVLPHIQYCIFYRKIDYYSDCLWLFSRISTNFCSKTSERGSLAYRIMVQQQRGLETVLPVLWADNFCIIGQGSLNVGDTHVWSIFFRDDII